MQDTAEHLATGALPRSSHRDAWAAASRDSRSLLRLPRRARGDYQSGVARIAPLHRDDSGVCERCRTHRINLDSVRVEFVFDGPLRKAIHALKYKHGTYLVPMLRDLCLETIRTRPLQPDALVPVPIGPIRLRQRGYNQAQLLAEAIGYSSTSPLCQCWSG